MIFTSSKQMIFRFTNIDKHRFGFLANFGSISPKILNPEIQLEGKIFPKK